MSFAASLKFAFTDEITVEPYASMTGAQVFTYGSAVTYDAMIQRGAKRVVSAAGREVISTVTVTIPNRVHIDQRSRVTLPSGFVPNQPPIIGVSMLKGLGMDHTELYL